MAILLLNGPMDNGQAQKHLESQIVQKLSDLGSGTHGDAIRARVNTELKWIADRGLPFICTTNLSEKIDEAAFRRFTFKTKFDYLKKDQVASAFHCFFGQECPGNTLALDSFTPGDFAVVKKKMEYFGGASAEEIGQMLELEMLAKPGRLNSRRVGFKAG